jgi:flagellar protein FlaG
MNPIASTTTSGAQGLAALRVASPVTQPDPAVASVTASQKSATSGKAVNPAASSSASKASAEEIQRATDDLQQRVSVLAPELQFSVDQSSGRSIIRFTDRATNEVIRQFPSEEALALTKAMDQFQRGLIFNRKA